MLLHEYKLINKGNNIKGRETDIYLIYQKGLLTSVPKWRLKNWPTLKEKKMKMLKSLFSNTQTIKVDFLYNFSAELSDYKFQDMVLMFSACRYLSLQDDT